MFVSITFAFWQLLQLLNTKFPFSQENHSHTIMNDVTLNPLVCNCWMLHFIAGHLMVYLFMLNFMTVTAVSQWRNDPFLSQEARFEFSLSKQFCHICPLVQAGFPLKPKLETRNFVASSLFARCPRKQEFRTRKSETEEEKAPKGALLSGSKWLGCLSEFSPKD